MEIALVLVVVALVVALATMALLRSQSVAPATVAPAPQLDTEMLVNMVRQAVDAQVRVTTGEAIDSGNKAAAQIFQERSVALTEQTKGLLGPFEQQIATLSAAVVELKSSYDVDKGTVQSMNDALVQQINQLNGVTSSLAGALKSPTARGAWGENQLRNIIQLSGMAEFCDFNEQDTSGYGETDQRPDMTVNLPNGAKLVIDSKVPLSAYLRMQDMDSEEDKARELTEHVKAVKAHAKSLADKKYWERFPDAPDFVVMFVPGESFLADAMRHDAGLMDDAMKQRVVIASPMSLMALLLTIARGWQTTQLAEYAHEVEKEGKELYKRVGKVLEAVNATGKGLETATKKYNDMVASIDGRMLPALRRFKDLGVTSEELPIINPVESGVRQISSVEALGELEA